MNSNKIFYVSVDNEKSISEKVLICITKSKNEPWWRDKYASPYEKMKKAYIDYIKGKKI
ncbi:MAG: hypothetical protein LBF00_03840 [Mycoplasmataceae bacterium]|jgi:hypothetical protein|nr:hypothetical protein [Mycoplasmataceae bacterium]